MTGRTFARIVPILARQLCCVARCRLFLLRGVAGFHRAPTDRPARLSQCLTDRPAARATAPPPDRASECPPESAHAVSPRLSCCAANNGFVGGRPCTPCRCLDREADNLCRVQHCLQAAGARGTPLFVARPLRPPPGHQRHDVQGGAGGHHRHLRRRAGARDHGARHGMRAGCP